jgi:hypothetical protein
MHANRPTTDATTDAAIKAAGTNADPAWVSAAFAAVATAAGVHPDGFTAADVWHLIPKGETTKEGRALGWVLREMNRAGMIEPTGRYISSGERRNHYRPMREWRMS